MGRAMGENSTLSDPRAELASRARKLFVPGMGDCLAEDALDHLATGRLGEQGDWATKGKTLPSQG